METINFATKEIEITSVYFRNRNDGQHFESFPKRMLLDGREYTFGESGIRYLIQKGQDLVKLFDVSDGQTQYPLASRRASQVVTNQYESHGLR